MLKKCVVIIMCISSVVLLISVCLPFRYYFEKENKHTGFQGVGIDYIACVYKRDGPCSLVTFLFSDKSFIQEAYASGSQSYSVRRMGKGSVKNWDAVKIVMKFNNKRALVSDGIVTAYIMVDGVRKEVPLYRMINWLKEEYP